MAIRAQLRRVRTSGWWKPRIAAYLVRNAPARRDRSDLPTDDESLRGVAAWLARAQDATGDGGIAGRYRLAGGWTSSYPETTGYTIPTLLTLATVLEDDQFRERAERCVDFLLSVQLECGGFPGLEIADNRTRPSPFNTAQILHGLECWYRATGVAHVLDPIRRAAGWMCDVQDADGCWRKHWYRELACSYSAHAACWLADAGDTLGERRFLDAAERNLHWVLAQYHPRTGWFDRTGFSDEDHHRRRAHTHTIAYTLDGVDRLSQRFDVAEGIAAVQTAAEQLLLRLERSRTLAGVLNHEWRAESDYVCLTGNAQIALIWLRLARFTADLRYANAAFKAIDQVKRSQLLQHPDPGIRGGIPGSSPVGGAYIQYALPNWAAKFFADALCAKRRCLNQWLDTVPSAVDHQPDARSQMIVSTGPTAQRVVVYTTRISPTFARLAARWIERRFSPALVVIETGPSSAARRWASSLRRRDDDAERICRWHGWRAVCATSVNAPAAIAAVGRVAPDLAVAAGSGILRESILSVPTIGTLGAHMGLLPQRRGMNVAEWSLLLGQPVGCSVFWIDKGIDTGPIVATSTVDAGECETVAQLRERVNDAQLTLLDDLLREMVEHGRAPVPAKQLPEEGRQYFRMHQDLLQAVQKRLEHNRQIRT
jgi:hypothetical protein